MPIGAHVSTSGGLPLAVPRAVTMGAECMQIFVASPQRWDNPRHTDQQVADFTLQVRAVGIGPNFAHARYLINLASPDPSIRRRSIDTLSTCATWAERCDLYVNLSQTRFEGRDRLTNDRSYERVVVSVGGRQRREIRNAVVHDRPVLFADPLQ